MSLDELISQQICEAQYRVWTLVSLEMWMRQFIDERARSGKPRVLEPSAAA